MKKVFVTGGTGGIGKSLCLAFARAGYEVGFSYCNNKNQADELLMQLNTVLKGYSFCADFSKEDSARRLFEQVHAKMGIVDVLINNAGVSSYGVIQGVSDEELERVFRINVITPVALTKFMIEPMVSQKFGSVINISSIWGETGASCEVLYSSTKAALIGFTKALAKELAPSDVTVNCIAPGVVDTAMMSRFSDDEKNSLCEEIPLGRFATPDEIAQMALFLCGDNGRYVTGQVIGINGGMYC